MLILTNIFHIDWVRRLNQTWGIPPNPCRLWLLRCCMISDSFLFILCCNLSPLIVTPRFPAGFRHVVQLAGGSRHVCALFNVGSVLCWGDHSHGQLGVALGTLSNTLSIPVSSLPVLTFPEAADSLAAGSFHTCALFRNGRLRCWGANNKGQLGYDNAATDPVISLASSLPFVTFNDTLGAVQVAAGDAHSCIITTRAKIRCFGSNEFVRGYYSLLPLWISCFDNLFFFHFYRQNQLSGGNRNFGMGPPGSADSILLLPDFEISYPAVHVACGYARTFEIIAYIFQE